MNEQGKTTQNQDDAGEVLRLRRVGTKVPPKLVQVVQSRKGWAGVIGLVMTLGLWWLGEIDGARAVEALAWVLGIYIGSVALEDGMARLLSTLAHAVAHQEPDQATTIRTSDEQER
jgi:hypothetical protein